MKMIFKGLKGQYDKENVTEMLENLKANKTKSGFLYDSSRTKIEGFRLLSSANNFKKVMTDKYKVLDHYDIMQPLVTELNELGVNYQINTTHNLWAYKNQFSANILFPEVNFNVDGSEVYGMLQLINSNDGSTPLATKLGFFRLACQNGMMVGKETLLDERQRHVGNMNLLKFEDIITNLNSNKEIFMKVIEKSMNRPVNEQFINKLSKYMPSAFVNSFSTPEKYHKIVEKYNIDNSEIIDNKIETVWNAYQYATNYLSNYLNLKDVGYASKLQSDLYATLLQEVS